MFLGHIDPRNRSLEYASAGHESGYLLRESGDIAAVLASTAPPLRIFPDQEFRSGPAIPLEHGDTIVLLTDGITETTDAEGALFGAEGALEFIRCRQRSTADELVQGLYRAAHTFGGNAPQMDDIMSLICKVE
jgi:sigma-B regulation protein RsbU (phosphoserine phosphatase)